MRLFKDEKVVPESYIMQHRGGSRDGNGAGGILHMAVHLPDVDVLVHVGQFLSKPFPDAHEASLHHHRPAYTQQPCPYVTVPNTATMSLCHSPRHRNQVFMSQSQTQQPCLYVTVPNTATMFHATCDLTLHLMSLGHLGKYARHLCRAAGPAVPHSGKCSEQCLV
jgi:hypothetical protein